MPSRPQFSLRMLLFVVVMVCLAAATVTDLPEAQPLANHVQSALRIVLCVAFPAMLIAGAVNRRKYVQVFCIGALFPALIGLATVCLDCDFALEGLHKSLRAYGNRGYVVTLKVLWKLLPRSRYELVTTWILAMGCGIVVLLVEWMFGVGDQLDRRNAVAERPGYVWRVALFAAATLCLLALVVTWSPQSARALHARELLTIALSMTLQGVLVVGALHSRDFVKSFCIGAALASCLGWPILCQALLQDAANRVGVFRVLVHFIPHRYSFAAVWVFAPIFGLTCGFFEWLFQLGAQQDAE